MGARRSPGSRRSAVALDGATVRAGSIAALSALLAIVSASPRAVTLDGRASPPGSLIDDVASGTAVLAAMATRHQAAALTVWAVKSN